VDLLLGGFEDADAVKVAVALGEIEAVADDEFVWNLETDEIRFEGHLAAAFFIEEDADAETGGSHPTDHAGDE
jgi:hypothetical protein